VCRLEQLIDDIDMPLRMHAGMAGGPVILLEGDDYTGTSVNLASRLMGAAAPHEILTLPALGALAPPGTLVEPAGLLSVPGFHVPVEVVRLGCGAAILKRR
jgi:class 3 adenylate cyclase